MDDVHLRQRGVKWHQEIVKPAEACRQVEKAGRHMFGEFVGLFPVGAQYFFFEKFPDGFGSERDFIIICLEIAIELADKFTIS